MANKEFKFDRFYYSVDGTTDHYLKDLRKLSDDVLKKDYSGKMYCPECKRVQLSFVHRGEGHLQSFPNQEHKLDDGKECMYAYEEAPQNVINTYVQKLQNSQKVRSLLESALRKLDNQHIAKAAVSKDSGSDDENMLIISEKKANDTKKYVFPHISFKNWGPDVPTKHLVILYGTVNVKNYTPNNSENKFLHFYDEQNSKKLIASCYRPKDISISDGKYKVVMLGTCSPVEGKGKTFYNIKLNYPQSKALLFETVSEP